MTKTEVLRLNAVEALKWLRAKLRSRSGRTLVGIDGILGAGKAQFADELAELLRESGISVVRVSMRDFANPKQVRQAAGEHTGIGYYQNYFNLPGFIENVIEPLSRLGSGRYLTKYYDADSECDCPHKWGIAPDESVVLVDGLFLHREEFAPEGRKLWDVSVWLELPFSEAFRRLHESLGLDASPVAPSNARYYEAEQHYIESCDPAMKADLVVDNAEEFHEPVDE
ncbi:MAG: hypothetical protein LBQ92_05765 [Propionibacteriaceae bacterium]|jgi:uridine kinase|nr:hypothetical protein [Propionibacteriaceae bacterium]